MRGSCHIVRFMTAARLLAAFIAFLSLPESIRGQTNSSESSTSLSDEALNDLVVRQWTLDDGMATESLTDVVRTSDGFLWLTTYEGLQRFDGLLFENFDKNRIHQYKRGTLELVADGFFGLTVDDSGILWVGGQEGRILRFEDGFFEIFQTPTEGPIFDLCFDAEGILWAAGVTPTIFDPRQESPQGVAVPGLEGVPVEALACEGRTVWLGSNDGVIYRARSGGELVHRFEVDLAIDAIAPGRDGSVWLGHRSGLSRLDGYGLTEIEEMRGISISQIAEDAEGNLWLATRRGLARRAKRGTIDWLNPEFNDLREAQAFHFGPEGNLWVAGRIGGLFRLKQGKVARIIPEDGLLKGAVDTLFQLRDGRILVGYEDFLAVIDEEQTVTRIPIPEEIGAFEILDVLEDRAGTLWLGGYVGLLRLFSQEAGGGYRFDHLGNGFPTSQIRILHEDSEGKIWIGTDNHGILTVRQLPEGGEEIEIYDRESGLLNDFVFSIEDGVDDSLLFGVRGGFHIRSRAGNLQTFRAGVDFPGSLVFNTAPDSEGGLLIATDSGVSRYLDGRFTHLGTGGGLPTGSIFDLYDDDIGSIWMSSTFGILRTSSRDFYETLESSPEEQKQELFFEIFDEEDGMPDRQCTGARDLLRTRSGELWFPTHGGIAIVDPLTWRRNERMPDISVRHFYVDDREVDQRETISLEARPDRYVFEFSVLSLTNPRSNRARYRLEGFDNDWRDADGQRRVTYTNLPAGEYVFRVIGANADGVWNREGARVPFEVRSFYYETIIFQIFVVGLVAFLGAALYRWRDRANRRRERQERILSEQRRKLIIELQERTDEIDRYLYIFSHDFKNPLHTINNYAGAIRQDLEKDDSERAVVDLERISAAADALNRQIDDLLKVAEANRAQSIQEAFSFVQIAEEAVKYHQEEIDRKSVHLLRNYEEEGPDQLILYGDRRWIQEVFIELIRNALTFLDLPKSEIEIGAIRQEAEALCWVRDNGAGIAPAYHEQIFQPLTKLDPRSQGTGTGLALVQRVVERHDGRVWIESAERKGTTIWLLLPLDLGKKR